MKRTQQLELTVLICLIILTLPLPASAQSPIQVTGNTYEYAFRDHIAFRLEATSDAEITEVTLFARLSGESGRRRDEPDFTPGQSVSAEVVWDEMDEESYRPPGVEVEYWWQIADAVGNELKTEAVTFVYMDDRHPWQVLENESVALYWYEGGENLGRALFDRAAGAVERIAAELGVEAEKELKIFIYGSFDDLRAALGEGSHEWVGGTSFADYGVVAAGVAPEDLDYGLRVVPHELTHAVIAQMMEPPFGQLPHWMNEGLAMHYEGPLTAGERTALEKAIAEDSLLSIRSLASNFPQDYDLAVLSYAESSSVVEFIFEIYGNEAMARLLEVFAVGAHQDDGLVEVLGFDVDGLEDAWRAHIGAPPRAGVTRATPVPRTATVALAETPDITLTPSPKQAATPQATATPAAAPERDPSTGPWCLSPLPAVALLALFLLPRPRPSA